jgi:CRISPR system Cascade subunit CasE
MYLTQINIDPSSRSAKKALASPEVMHAIIEKCFEKSERNLWRLDSLRLLVVSTVFPSNPEAALQLGGLPVCKDYDPFLKKITEGINYRFRLTANPVHSVKMSSRDRGKVLAHVTISQQMDWLVKKAEKFGCEPRQFSVTESGFVIFRRQGRQVTLKLATFEGNLIVTNRELFITALTGGVGRGKAYGAGMLTVMR